MRFIYICIFLVINAGLSAQSLPMGHPPTGKIPDAPKTKIQIRGIITNATKKIPQKADKIELILLTESGRTPLQEQNDAGPNFAFEKMDSPETPLLIRVSYKGEAYSKLISPDPRALNDIQKINVYENLAKETDLKIQSILEFVKKKDHIKIVEIYAISNFSNPPQTFSPDIFFLPLPEGITELKAYLANATTNTPTPVDLEKTDKGYRLKRGFQPGNSELTIEYTSLGHKFSSSYYRIIPQGKDPVANGKGNTLEMSYGNPRIVAWIPRDAKPEVQGGYLEKLDIPNFGEAMRVSYPSDGSPVIFDLQKGSYDIDDPFNSGENSLFDSPIEASIAIAGAFLFFLTLYALILGSGVTIQRNKNKS